MDWQAIETAPIEVNKHSEPMLIFCPGITSWNRYDGASPILVGRWTGFNWESDVGDVQEPFYDSEGTYFQREKLRPTHWMPLPREPGE